MVTFGERQFWERLSDELTAWLQLNRHGADDLDPVWMHKARMLAAAERRLSKLDEAERLARVPLRVVMRG